MTTLMYFIELEHLTNKFSINGPTWDLLYGLTFGNSLSDAELNRLYVAYCLL